MTYSRVLRLFSILIPILLSSVCYSWAQDNQQEINRYLAMLKSEESSERRLAVLALKAFPNDRVISILIETLKDKNEQVRVAAATSLMIMDDSRAQDAYSEYIASR